MNQCVNNLIAIVRHIEGDTNNFRCCWMEIEVECKRWGTFLGIILLLFCLNKLNFGDLRMKMYTHMNAQTMN